MEALALPVLSAALGFFVVLAIWISARNPPQFWMDEKRLPDRQIKKRRKDAALNSAGQTSERRRS